MSAVEEVNRELIKAGEAVAGMLGIAVAAMEDGKPFNPIEVSMVRTELVRWQRGPDAGRRVALGWSRRPRRRKPTASTTARGYGAEHQKARAELAPRVAAGLENCARCGWQIRPGEPWDLDHTDDRTGYLGASHARCNRATAGRRKRKQGANAQGQGLKRTTREW